jgi:hypothetical protein
MDSKSMIVFVAILGAVGLFVVGVPITEVQVQEEYQENVEYEVEVPFQVTVDKEWEHFTILDYELNAYYYVAWTGYVPQGRIVEFYVSASDDINMFIMTEAEFSKYEEGSFDVQSIVETEGVSTETISFLCTASRDYRFVCENPITGFGDSEDVVLRVGWGLSSWEEEDTQYRTETEYRLETKTRWVTKKVTIIEKITGDY